MKFFLKRFIVIFLLATFSFQLDLSADILAQKLGPALEQAASGRRDKLRSMKTVLRSLFSCIPYYPQIKINSDEALQLTLYSIFKSSGFCVNLGKREDDPILIVNHNGTNYLISCEFRDVRPIHLGSYQGKKFLLKPHPKREKKKAKSLSKINRKSLIEYEDFEGDDSEVIGLRVILYGDDTEYQKRFFGEFPDSAQIDSRLKIYVDDSLNNSVSINSDRSFSCDTDCISSILNCLNNGANFRSNFNDKAEELSGPFRELFEKIPYEISCEKGFHLVLYAMFKTKGFDVDIELSSAAGRSDLVVKAGENIYIFELKYSNRSFDIDKAMTQIILKRYSERYFYKYKRNNIFGIAVSFGPDGLKDLTVARLPEPVTPVVLRKRRYVLPGTRGRKRCGLSLSNVSDAE